MLVLMVQLGALFFSLQKHKLLCGRIDDVICSKRKSTYAMSVYIVSFLGGRGDIIHYKK